MNSELATTNPPPATSPATDQEVLVKVEGVSKKFCRSLKKSLWYGLCDIGGELNPLSRKAEKLKLGNSENGSISASQNVSVSDFPPAARDEDLRDGEFYAVRDVSFELRRGECLGLIGHNGAGTQAANVAARKTAAGSPEGEMSGSERINTTLLKMLNGLIKPDAGRITMRGRVGVDPAVGVQRPESQNREPESAAADGDRAAVGRPARASQSCWRVKISTSTVRCWASRKGNRNAREGVEIGCQRQARRASRCGFRLGEHCSSERRNANQIDGKIDEIIDFAEIGELIDSPVQNYKWTASFERANYQS